MTGQTDRRKLIFPYLLIFAIFSISIVILDVGWSAIYQQKQQKAQLQREDEARQILGTLVYGSGINPYLTRISAFLKGRLPKPLLNNKNPGFDPHQRFLKDFFPEHEIWAFSYAEKNGINTAQPCLYPKNSTASRRGMANAFAAIDANTANPGNDKLIDFLFGPGLKIKDLTLRKGMPTRVIFQNKHHLLVWDTISVEGKKAGGFFFLIPDSLPLQRFAMTVSSRSATAGKFNSRNSLVQQCFAGYMRIFPAEIDSVYPRQIAAIPDLTDFLRDWQNPPKLTELERKPLPWARKYGAWELYTNAIPYSSHLAFVLLPKTAGEPAIPLLVSFGNTIYFISVLLILAGYFGTISLPALKLQTRFSLLFICLAAIPFSLFFIAANMYLEELRISLIREARQKLFTALSSFDQNVEDVYLFYRSELQKLHQTLWLSTSRTNADAPAQDLLEKTQNFLQNLSPPLPWGSIMFLNPDGKTVQAFRTPYHQTALDGFSKFDRIGLIDAMRKSNGLCDMETASESSFISDSDVAIKKAFETLVRLPVCHGFVNKSIGQPTQVAFGNLSIVRIFDYFPSAQNLKVAFAVAWLEEELDSLFCSEALKKLQREYPSLNFAIFRKERDELKKIAQTHKQSNLLSTAFSASLQNGFSFSLSAKTRSIKIAFASKRRPGIILAGAMDTGFIDEKLDSLTYRFFCFSVIGLLAILYFRKLLSGRLILPFLLLQKSLANVQEGHLLKLPQIRRRDEIWKIFTSFNAMLDGLKARQRLLSLVSGKALQIVREKPGTGETDFAKTMPVIAMVSDIRGFTTLCERNLPDVITRLLNLHFDRMSQIIYAHGGEVSRFVGDAIEASFPCPDDQQEEIMCKVVGASLAMLGSMSLINEERERQGHFPYKIGIGLSYGQAHIFHVGKSGGRTEVLQVGEPLKKAEELEAFSKEFSGCPLIMDVTIGETLGKMADYADIIEKQTLESEAFYIFSEFPRQQSYLAGTINNAIDEASQTSIENHNLSETLNTTSFARFSLKMQEMRIHLFPGLALLLIPFLLGISGIYYGFFRLQNDLIQEAHSRNQYALECEKIPLVKKEMVEIQLQKALSELAETAGSLTSIYQAAYQQNWQKKIESELLSFGLIPEEIIFSPFSQSGLKKPVDVNKRHLQEDTRKERLANLLQDCLRCYSMQFDRFLQPDEKKLDFLGEAMSGTLLARDTRSRFATVTIASDTFWIYWQPVLNLAWARESQNNISSRMSGDISNDMRLYGRFPESEHPRLILGGVLILCRPPQSIAHLRQKPENSSTLSAHIDLKSLTIDEERGNLDNLLNDQETSQSQNLSRVEKLLSLAHQTSRDETKWAIDKILVPGPAPKVHVVATPPATHNGVLQTIKAVGLAVIILLMILTTYFWYQVINDRGMARTVNGQILGSFIGTMLLPAAGLFIVLTLLAGDWKANLLKESEADFLHQVELMEQKVRFHHYANPKKVRQMLTTARINSLLEPEMTSNAAPPEPQVARQKLQAFLKNVYQKLLLTSQALGITSIMVDSSTGLSEFLLIDGDFAAENDPMKKTFSFHANRIVQRISGTASKESQTKDANSLLVDEMTCQLVFDVFSSTFGSDATLEILFGQGKGIELFSSVSNDVFFQEVFPNMENPMGVVFILFSHLHSNQFSLARILAAQHFQRAQRDPLEFEIFAANKLSPGMPLMPETGETKPFLREIARQSMLTGHLEKTLTYEGEEYYVSTRQSIVLPQFVFLGVVKKSLFSNQVRDRIASFVAIFLLFFSLLLLLSKYTAQDITEPLTQLLEGLARVKNGDYHGQLSFGREDELERIAEAFTGMVRQLSEKNVLARMVSESAAEMAHSDEAESEALKGKRRNAAVAYFGIPRFNELLNHASREEIRNKLGKWVENVCSNVTAHGGEIDKIMEGKILTVFFAEKDTNNISVGSGENLRHLEQACQAALQICSNSLPGLLPTSCGIHVGDVISGLMGNQERRDYTIIGDPVNLAARCFSIAEKMTDTGSIISTAETVALLSSDFAGVDLGNYQIKGKQQPIRLFRLQKKSESKSSLKVKH